MDFRKLNAVTWKGLDENGDLITGYKSCWLSLYDQVESNLHIFKDKSGNFHFAVEATDINKNDIESPKVNGLEILLISYKFNNGRVSQFIDLICNISSYLEEFTEVVKEITKAILEDQELPIKAVNQTINNWISFWAKQRKEILTEEEQVGLICELVILNNLCEINPKLALKTWSGPLGEKHDFNFTDWTIEVKGTRKSKRIHTINGIDQLEPAQNKHLAFVSFMLSASNNENTINLSSIIESIINEHFLGKPDLIVRFNELIANLGYSPLHISEYNKFNIEILESTFYEVDENFPKLTSNMLNEPINSRVTLIRYDINLEGIQGKNLNEVCWGNYFF